MPEARHPLLEREDEVGALRLAVDGAAAGSGRALLIEAPAGVGKSSLLATAELAAERRGLRVLRARGGELERDFAFGAVRQLFEPVLAARPAAERATLLGGSAAAAAAVVDPVGAPVQAGFALLHALFWLVANLSARSPLLLCVDDLHWLDEASLRTLDYVARRAGELPLLVVGTLRPAEPGAHTELLDALRGGVAATLVPAALTPAAVAAVVRGVRTAAPDAVCAAYGEASAGNPLYLRELLRATPHASPDAIRAAAVPTVGEQVLRRIAQVGPDAPALAEALAVLGDGQPLDRVGGLAGLEPEPAADVARALARIDILGSDEPPAFAHPVIRHSVYAQLSAARRGVLHAGAAELLHDPDAVAAQLVALPAAGSAAVATGLREAGRTALSRGAAEVAVRRLRRALDEGAAEPTRAELLLDLGRSEAALSDPACLPHLQEAFAIAPDALKPEVATVLADVLAGAGAWEEVRRVMDAALAVAVPGSPAHGYLTATLAIQAATDAGQTDAFLAAWDRHVSFAAGEDWGALAMSALLASQSAFLGHPREEVLSHARRAMTGGRLLAEHGGGSWATMQVHGALVAVDALDEADRWVAEVAAAGRRTGSTLQAVSAMAADAWVTARRGDLLGAEAAVAALVDIASDAGMTMWLSSIAFTISDVLAERPSLDALADRIDAVELPPAFEPTWAGAMLGEAQGWVAHARGDRGRALQRLQAVAPVYAALRVGPGLSAWRSRLARALAPDDPDAAAAVAATELELARAAGYPRAIGIALRTTGVLAGDAAPLRESLAVLADTPAALERVATQLELGALLRRSLHLPEAREHLAAAVDGARRCGAERTLRRATEELLAAGARPRRSASTGREALTPRELRTAELAAAGRSNAEIAQDLFVSLKTVETHLSRVYAKLGLAGHGSRAALAAALAV